MLATGRQRLAVTFIPADSTDYATAEASVTLVVEGLPNLASLMPPAADANLDAKEAERRAEFVETKRMELESYGAINPRPGEPETRTYKGATYVKGVDGQWHLLKK